MNYTGSCHCGNIKFEVEGTLDSVMECNCSICLRQGALRWFAPPCSTCGCAPYGEGVNLKTGAAMAAINARCIEGVDIAALKITKFDGRSL